MAKTYADLSKQIKQLEAEAEALRKKEVGDVIARIKEAIRTYRLTAAGLGLSVGPGRRKSAMGQASAKKATVKRTRKAGVKYRDEAGNTWGGRGPRPKWLRDALAGGKQLEDFAA